MKETGLTGKGRSTTIAATPDDGKSQRKRRRSYKHVLQSFGVCLIHLYRELMHACIYSDFTIMFD